MSVEEQNQPRQPQPDALESVETTVAESELLKSEHIIDSPSTFYSDKASEKAQSVSASRPHLSRFGDGRHN
jgi:hypothetical protein